MVHCPECDATFQAPEDVVFVDTDSSLGFISASKRYYTMECAHCGAVIGSGVAGAKSNAGGAAN